MSTDQLRKQLIEELGLDEKTIDYLWTIGLISEKETRRWLLQKSYYFRLSQPDRDSCFNITVDLSEEFGVSTHTAKNYIYEHSHIA